MQDAYDNLLDNYLMINEKKGGKKIKNKRVYENERNKRRRIFL